MLNKVMFNYVFTQSLKVHNITALARYRTYSLLAFMLQNIERDYDCCL